MSLKRSIQKLVPKPVSLLAISLLILIPFECTEVLNAQVFSFGSNGFGQTGLGTSSGSALVPTAINPANFADRKIIKLAAPLGQVESHSLLVDSSGRAYAFGRNSDGRTGQGTTAGNTLIATPIDPTHLTGKSVIQAAAGGAHSLLLADDGSVFGMGAGGLNGIGSGIVTVAAPIDATNLAGRNVSQVAAGMFHNLVLTDDGTVFSFGTNEFGRTGLGTETGSTFIATPIDTTNIGGRKIVEVAAGGLHSLILADDGAVFSFGWNGFGATGRGTLSGSTLIATQINQSLIGGKHIAHVAAGGGNSLLVADDGTVFAFGDNSFGKTGLGTTIGRTTIATPIDTTNLSNVEISDVSVGAGHSLLLSRDGDVFTFGINSFGRTGLGTTIGNTLVATRINSGTLNGLRVTDIAAGFNHSLLLAVPEPDMVSLLILAGASLSVVTSRHRSRGSRFVRVHHPT